MGVSQSTSRVGQVGLRARAEHSAIWGLRELRRQAQGEAGPFEGKEVGEGTIWDVSLQLRVTEKLKPKAP